MAVPAQRDLDQAGERLAGWLSDHLPSTGKVEVSNLRRPDSSGFSNETVMLDAAWTIPGGRTASGGFVVRVAPTGYQLFLEPRFAEQYRVMSTLGARTAVPIPPLYGFESDTSLLGAPFFVMGAVAGRVPPDNPPYHVAGWLHEITPAERERLWWSGIDMLARVHSVDVEALDLSFLDDPGRGRTGVDQELTYYEQMLEWTGADAGPVVTAAGRWLRDNQPTEDAPPRLLWGDARIGNIVFDENREARAVLDWEMTGLGQPEQDLAWFLFLDKHHSDGCGVPRLEGFPSHEATIARYAELTGRQIGDLAYYEILAAYRFGVIMFRLMLMLTEWGLMPPDSDMALNNTVTRMLAAMLDLPSPGPAQPAVYS